MLQRELYSENIAMEDKDFNFHKLYFLKSLRTSPKSKNKYKRSLLSPLRYAGGKSLAVGIILELIPNDVKKLFHLFLAVVLWKLLAPVEQKLKLLVLIFLIFL